MKRLNRYHYLNMLAEIRDYLREVNPGAVDDGIVDNFNALAKKLGSTEGEWMQKGEHANGHAA